MKKIKLNEKFFNMGEKNKIYYFSGIRRSYGYDIFDEDFIFSFGFGESLKNHFVNFSELNINFFEKIKLTIRQYSFIIRGYITKLIYHTF